MEESSTFPVKCGFCGHGNPAGSRYCNACGGPLTSEPCPECGAVNNVMATTCQECGASLEDSLGNELFLPLPPEAPAGPRAISQQAETPMESPPPRQTAAAIASVTGDDGVPPKPQPVAQSVAVRDMPLAESQSDEAHPPAAIQAAETTTEKAAVIALDSARPSTADEPEPQGAPPFVSAAPVPSDEGAARGPSKRTLWSIAIVVALGITVYFAYRHLHRWQPDDAPRAAATRDAKERTMPAVPDKPPAAAAPPAPGATAKPIVRGEPAPAIFAPDRETAAASQGSAAGGTGARGGQSTDSSGAAASKPQPPTDIFLTKPQETPKATAAGAQKDGDRPSAGVGAGIAQRAPGGGPCTDALAALGLCKQENNQRREQ